MTPRLPESARPAEGPCRERDRRRARSKRLEQAGSNQAWCGLPQALCVGLGGKAVAGICSQFSQNLLVLPVPHPTPTAGKK